MHKEPMNDNLKNVIDSAVREGVYEMEGAIRDSIFESFRCGWMSNLNSTEVMTMDICQRDFRDVMSESVSKYLHEMAHEVDFNLDGVAHHAARNLSDWKSALLQSEEKKRIKDLRNAVLLESLSSSQIEILNEQYKRI